MKSPGPGGFDTVTKAFLEIGMGDDAGLATGFAGNGLALVVSQGGDVRGTPQQLGGEDETEKGLHEGCYCRINSPNDADMVLDSGVVPLRDLMTLPESPTTK